MELELHWFKCPYMFADRINKWPFKTILELNGKRFLWNTRAVIKNHTTDLSSSAFYSHQKLGLLTAVETAGIVSTADGALTDSLPSQQLRVSLYPEAQSVCFLLLFFFSLKKKYFSINWKDVSLPLECQINFSNF